MAECGITTAVINAATGECNNWGNTAKDCAIGCAAGMGLGWLASKLPGLAKKAWDAIRCGTGFNSFAADTLVHVKPDEAMAGDAKAGKSRLKPINQINVGDEVLAFSEWKDKGKSSKMDRRLSYEKVTDVYTSYKAQTLVHLTLDDGQTLTATEGHPFKTADGWRDAIMLKKGGKLLLKGGDGDADAERTATIAEVRTEQKTLPVYNLEVANGHTYFVGIDGELVHNAIHHICTNKHSSWSDRFRELFNKAGLGRFKNGNSRRDVLNDPLNKVSIPGHRGPHSPEMHQQTSDRLNNALENGGANAFREELGNIKNEALTPGNQMHTWATGGK